MTLNQLKGTIQQILDDFPDADDAEVEVAQWYDGAYDGQPVVGVRVIWDVEDGGKTDGRMTVFIIHK